MNKQTEALKMAIAELEKGEGWMDNVNSTIQACKEALEQPLTRDWKETIDERIAKDDEFKKALEQPVQEAVERDYHEEDGCPTELAVLQRFWRKHQQPAQEPYGWIYEECIDDTDHAIGYYYTRAFSCCEVDGGIPVYTHPAPLWQGLSDDEVEDILLDYAHDRQGFARAIEQLLRSKNETV